MKRGEYPCPPYCSAPALDTLRPVELVCRKDGYLDYRMQFAVAWKGEVELEEGAAAGAVAAGVAMAGLGFGLLAFPVAGVPALAVAAPTAALSATGAVAVGAVAASVAADDAARKAPRLGYDGPTYGYRSLPKLVLTPATFSSEAAREAFFATLKDKLEAAAAEERIRTFQTCRIWPCAVTDTACSHPACEHRRALIDSELKRRLEQIPALRDQVRIVEP